MQEVIEAWDALRLLLNRQELDEETQSAIGSLHAAITFALMEQTK